MPTQDLKRKRIDWQAVRQQLEANQRELEQVLSPTPQRIEEVYRTRAIKLAQEEKKESTVLSSLPVLVFRLGPERFALELKSIAEVLRFEECTPIPRSPTQFLGVISLRGEFHAVVDLRRWLTSSGDVPDTAGFVLVLQRGIRKEQIGLKVDSIEELAEIQPEELVRSAQGKLTAGVVAGSITLISAEAVLANISSGTDSDTTSNLESLPS